MPTLILTLFLFIKVLSSPKEILNKYSSIRTNHSSIIFNISEFKYDQDIYLTIKSEEKCVENIVYRFYDDIKDINNKAFKYKIRPRSVKNKKLLGPKYYSYFYSIVKRKEFMLNTKGNLLYLVFNCGGEVEIINEKRASDDIYLTVVLSCSVIMLVIFLFIIIKEMIYSCIIVMKKSFVKKINYKINGNMNNINKNIYIMPETISRNYPQEREVHIKVRNNMYNINSYNNNSYQIDYNNNRNFNNIKNNNPYIIPVNYSLSDNSSNSPNQSFITPRI